MDLEGLQLFLRPWLNLPFLTKFLLTSSKEETQLFLPNSFGGKFIKVETSFLGRGPIGGLLQREFLAGLYSIRNSYYWEVTPLLRFDARGLVRNLILYSGPY